IMQWLASICVRRPVFATVIILTIAVVGFIGYSKLNVDRFPNVDLPIAQVVTLLPGASPQEVETELSDKIEEAINTISGIDELRSISTEGVSQVIVSGRKRQIQVMLEPARLRGAGLTAIDVQRAIVAQNISTPGGTVDTGPQRLTFRVSGRVQNVQAIEEIIVRAVEGHPILIRDV